MLSRRAAVRREKRLAPGAWIESLEPRTYFDLVPTVAGALPASLVATLKTPAMITVDLQNTGGVSIKGAYSISLLASPDGQLDDATPIIQKNEMLAPLAAGKTIAIKVPMGAVPALANGSYFVLAEVGGPLAGVGATPENPGDTVAASAGEITIANPFVDLINTSIALTGPANVLPGKTVSVSVTVLNDGNIPAKGPLQIQLGTSVNADGSQTAVFATEPANINLAPGKTATLHYSAKVPVGFTPGQYFATAEIAPASNAIVDSNTNNNFAVAGIGLTVLDPFVNIQGAFNGAFAVTKGPTEGTKANLALYVTSESNTTGAIAGTGVNTLGESFTFDGSVTTAGAVTINTNDAADGIASVLKGTVAHGKISGSFTQTFGDDGTFALLPALSSFGIGANPPAGFQANGSSQFVNSGGPAFGRLTSNTQLEVGSIFSTSQVGVSSFQANFTFQISGNRDADGFAFVLQTNSPTTIAPADTGVGGGLGYTGIANSLAVKFDIYQNGNVTPPDPSADATGLYINGAPPLGGIDLRPSGVSLASGDVFLASITESAGELTTQIVDLTNPAHPSFSHTYLANIPVLIGASTAYVGFTGATGSGVSIFDIQSFSFSSSG